MSFLHKLFGNNTETPEEKDKEKAEKNEKDFDVLKYDGIRALKTGQFEYAIRCFKKALDLYDDLEIRDYLSEALIRNNELLPALGELKKLLEAEPDNEKILIRMANVTYMMEDYDTLSSVCQKIIKLNPNNAVAYFFYARAYKGQGDFVNALAMVTKALAIDDKFVDAYMFRGEILLQMGDADGADSDAMWLLDHTDNDEDVLLFKARVERAKGNNKEAIGYYNKVTDVDPFSIDAVRERGALKLAIGDKEGAEEDGQKLLELNPNEVDKVSGKFKAEGKE